MALINQKAGSSQGNPNAVLYGLAAKQTYSTCSAESTTNSSACYFNDIDTGTIAAPCFAGTVNCTAQTAGDKLGILPGYAATTGYDKATGLGSLNVANVVKAWPSTTPAPAVTLSPTSLTFAATTTSATSAAQTVTLTNAGSATLSLSGITITGTNLSSFSQANTCGATLAASASCAISVSFKPATAGSLSATLSIADNGSNSPQTVALSGTGAAPPIVSVSISPASLTFPSTTVGASSAMQVVTFTNTGTASVTFTSSPTLTGTYASLFHGATSCGGNATLAPGASCLIDFTFNPTAAGTFSATLSFNDTAPNTPQSITLSGTGVGAPAASFSPASLAFASTIVGASSAMQGITLKNTGTAALTLSGITIGGANATSFSQTNNCGTSLAISASCTVTVTFKPASAGALSASLNFADNAANSPQAVALSGTGNAPAVSLSPVSLAFASTIVSASSATQGITLKNTGTAALTLSGITIGGANATSFSETNNCGTSLAISASCTVTVTFKPAAGGALAASLSFADNAAASPQAVALSGTGIVPAPVVTLSLPSLSFPVTAVSAAGSVSYSPAQAITLTNTGNAVLTISSITLSGTNPTSFTQMNNCPSSLAAASSCTALVRFTPTAAGIRSATLVFSDNASPTTQSVALSGTGAVAPAIALSSTTLSFGSVTHTTTSVAQAVTLTNSSATTPLNLTSIALSGTAAASYVQVNNCGAALAPSSSCIVLVQFAPTATGAATASLTVTANNPTATSTVALSGTGQ
jgi:hypothetical protein